MGRGIGEPGMKGWMGGGHPPRERPHDVGRRHVVGGEHPSHCAVQALGQVVPRVLEEGAGQVEEGLEQQALDAYKGQEVEG